MSENPKEYTEKQHRRALVENEAMDSRAEELYVASKYDHRWFVFRSPRDAMDTLFIGPSEVAEKLSKDCDFLEKLSPEAYQVLEDHFLAQKEFRDILPESLDRAEVLFFFKKVFGFLDMGFSGNSHLDFLTKISLKESKKILDKAFQIGWDKLVEVCKTQENWPTKKWNHENEIDVMEAARKSFDASLELAKGIKDKESKSQVSF